MSLRVRIALAVAFLGSLLVGVVLWVTLSDLLSGIRHQLRVSEQVMMDLLADHSREALLTEDFGNLQAHLDRATRHPRLHAAIVANTEGQVVVATDTGLLGSAFAKPADTEGNFWRTRSVNGRINPLGTMAVEFSERPYVHAYEQARDLGLSVAGIGILASALIGLLIGHLLTSRLHGLADAADRIQSHATPAMIEVPTQGPSEVARLGRAFAAMLGRLHESYEALRIARDQLLQPSEAMSQGFALWDAEDRVVLRNRRFCEMFSRTAQELVPGTHFLELEAHNQRNIDPAAFASDPGWMARRQAYHRDPQGVFLLPLADGRFIELREARTPDGGTVGIYTDVTHERRQQLELMSSERRLRAMMDSVFDAVITTDGRGRIESLNPSAERTFGWCHADAKGLPISVLVGTPAEAPYSSTGTLEQLEKLTPDVLCEMEGRHRHGRAFPIEISAARIELDAVTSMLFTIRDISERKANELRIVHHATHDRLTSLPNRSLLEERLEQALRLSDSEPEPLAVMFIDLDRFKTINDSLGHMVGDGVLIAVAERLRLLLPAPHTVARLGGDEFIVLLRKDGVPVLDLARRILEDLRRPMLTRGHELTVTASIGISLYPDHGGSADSLFRHADLALYQAKSTGKDRVCLYQPEMSVRGQRQALLESRLRRALGRGDLTLHYQPEIDLETGEICCLEALTRWHHPELGVVPPDEFIPIAEETALVADLGRWVLDTVCRDLTVWRHLGLRIPRVAINVSPRELDEAGFVTHLLATLDRHRVSTREIELELTERVLMREGGRALRHLEQLATHGVGLTLDDFGTGYWSLSHLKRCPIRRLKIDRSFIDSLKAARDVPLVRATVAMARALDIDVVAEGIEEAAQWRLLVEAGCRLGQGYLICRPLPLGEVTSLLTRDPPLAPVALGETGNVLPLRQASTGASICQT